MKYTHSYLEKEITKILNDKWLHSKLKSRFGVKYGDYESYIPGWAMEAIERYDPSRNASLRTYASIYINYSFLTKIKQDRKYNSNELILNNYHIETFPSKTVNINKVREVESTFKDIIDQFIKSKRRRKSNIDLYELIADFIGINRDSLKTSEIIDKYDVSRQYVSRIYSQFIEFIKSNEIMLDKIKNLYYT
jgi:hypothetical protein